MAFVTRSGLGVHTHEGPRGPESREIAEGGAIRREVKA
jgi:hypothetical protein